MDEAASAIFPRKSQIKMLEIQIGMTGPRPMGWQCQPALSAKLNQKFGMQALYAGIYGDKS